MSTQSTENQVQPEVKQDTTADNLVKQRQMYERKLEQERQERIKMAQELEQIKQAMQEREKISPVNEAEDDDQPYVDNRKLGKTLDRFGKEQREFTKEEIRRGVAEALENERRSQYLKENKDFDKIMSEDNINKFAETHPELAENILRMPDGFERQKLVYASIKALGIDRPPQKQTSVQDKIDANRRSPYYQPSGVGTAPYATGPAGKDYSESDKKNAYEQMKALKSRLRLG
jgi:hypothetical protein